MFGAQSVEREKPTAAANPFLDNPFAKAFQDMMAGMNPQQPTKAPEPPKDEAKEQTAGYMDMLNSMFDSGLEVQKSYQKNLESIFDAYRPKAPSPSSKP